MRISKKEFALLWWSCLIVVFILALSQQAFADRIKDLASVAGVRNNQLAGYILSPYCHAWQLSRF